MKKIITLFAFLLLPCFVFAEQSAKPILGKLIEREGRLYDTFYYSINGEPQYLLQKYDEIAIPLSVALSSLDSLDFHGVKLSEMIKGVSFQERNFRAFKIGLDRFDRANWIQIKNILAKNNIPAWPVLTYHAKERPIVLDGTMNITFFKYTPLEKREEILTLFNLQVVEIVDENSGLYTVSLPVGRDPFAIANRLFERGLVRWAQPNWLWRYELKAVTPNDPYYQDQWHLTQIRAHYAWETETAANKDVRIAIIDSGVDLDHPDLNVLSQYGRDYLGNLGGAPNISQDDHEAVPHGTSCAGLAAAKTNNSLGVAASCWGCPIIPIRLIGGYNYPNDIYNAIKYAIDSGAAVISNSWGAEDKDQFGNCVHCPTDNTTSQAIDYGRTNGRGGKGSIFLWAAGNSACPTYYQDFLKDNDMLTVSALSPSGKREDYSNYGDEIDISAGAGRYTTDIRGQYGYNYSNYDSDVLNDLDYTSVFAGTSAATPVAAGAVALMLAANPNLDFSGAMNCIKASAYAPSVECDKGGWVVKEDEWLADGSGEHSPCFGFGVVDAHAMVVGAMNGTCGSCIPTSDIDLCWEDGYDKDDDCDGIVDNECDKGGKGKTGDPCSADSNCLNAGPTSKCIVEEGWKDGYCSATCSTISDCHNGNKVECYEGRCIAKCDYNEIRSGYSCVSGKILPSETEAKANCGNGIKEKDEACDGGYKQCKSIDSGYTDGYAMCREDCLGYDTTACVGGSGDVCGNGNVDLGEICDSQTIPCKQLAGAPKNGTAFCRSDCMGWDKSGCSDNDENYDDDEKKDCGDGFVDFGEECDDGNRINGDGCSEDCMNELASSDDEKKDCGDGFVDFGEECDDGNRINGDGCSEYCMNEFKKSSSGCALTLF